MCPVSLALSLSPGEEVSFIAGRGHLAIVFLRFDDEVISSYLTSARQEVAFCQAKSAAPVIAGAEEGEGIVSGNGDVASRFVKSSMKELKAEITYLSFTFQRA